MIKVISQVSIDLKNVIFPLFFQIIRSGGGGYDSIYYLLLIL